jgi:hypothetical protein
MFGASENLPFTPGEWQIGFAYRGLTSNDHYSGVEYQEQRAENDTYVINTQQIYDLSLTYTATPRWSFSASLPVVNASWSIPAVQFQSGELIRIGPRSEQNSSGLGDFTALARYWLLDPVKHPRGNISAGLGLKAPTGDEAVTDSYPVLNGTSPSEKAVDQSIQPGDGGWGVLFDFQGYRRWSRVAIYGSGTYLANPRDTNGTPSIAVGLGFPGTDNSVPDQYLLRLGTSFPIQKTGLALTIGLRMEGVPRYDLIGDSHGFRRPGYETFADPGAVWAHGSSTWSLHVPIGLVRNRQLNPYTGNPGDATFPDAIVLFGYSYRFGGAARQPDPAAAPAGSGRTRAVTTP